MPHCPRCGAQVEEDDKYCPYCGFHLRREISKRKTQTWKYIKYACYTIAIIILIAVIGLSVASYLTASTRTPRSAIGAAYPDIRVIDVHAKSYLAGLDVRARVKAVLHNYGNADGYAVVKLYTIWDTTRDESIQTVFVPAGSSISVEADLDVPAFSGWRYYAEVLSQRKA